MLPPCLFAKSRRRVERKSSRLALRIRSSGQRRRTRLLLFRTLVPYHRVLSTFLPITEAYFWCMLTAQQYRLSMPQYTPIILVSTIATPNRP